MYGKYANYCIYQLGSRSVIQSRLTGKQFCRPSK
jgi:hypothetical protein